MLLSFEETQELLSKYKVPLVEGQIIKSPQEGIDFARQKGWPVVLKVDYQELTHRTDLGLVRVGIKNEEGLQQAFLDLRHDFDKGRILIQKTAQGVEVICGMKQDPTFGPVLLFGLGGVFVEVLKDITFGIVPVTRDEAYQMIYKLKGYSLFKGYRGRDPLYAAKVVDLLIHLSDLAQKEEQIIEINFNPVFVSETEVAVADAKVTL
jgi:acyl-CoA synthetase (NDP forming)